MRLIMMGTGPFAVPALRKLAESEHEVLALVTRPEKPGRGKRKAPSNPMRELAQQIGLKTLEPADVNTPAARGALAALQPELLIVADYGQILSGETLSVAEHGGFNIHASLLPKYRGAAPVNWAIYHGETETGVTVIQMTPRLDAGPCVAQAKTKIEPDETAVELEARLAEMGADLVLKSIADLQAGRLESIPQDRSQVSKAPRLKKSDGLIDWGRSAKEIRNQIRAMQPWPKCFSFLHDSQPPQRLIVNRVAVAEAHHSAAPGEVLSTEGERLLVAAGQGAVEVLEVQPAGKRAMSTKDFLHGHPVKAGQTFGPTEPA